MKKEKETQDNKISPKSQEGQGAKIPSDPATTYTESNYKSGFPNKGAEQHSKNKSK
ncbi:hypothetical protein [Runella sp.]|uniref:hypothetical protein n=1 Tax=Runella sp. TaxID=1960881 RepID=UPI003D0F6580